MLEVYVKFNSLEEAMQALQAKNLQPAAPQQFNHVPPAPAPAPYAPPQQAQAPYAPPAPAAPYIPAPPPAYAPPMPPSVAQAPGPAPAPAATGGISMAQVTAAAQAYSKVHGAKGAKAVMQQYGITTVAQLDPSQYSNILQSFAV